MLRSLTLLLALLAMMAIAAPNASDPGIAVREGYDHKAMVDFLHFIDELNNNGTKGVNNVRKGPVTRAAMGKEYSMFCVAEASNPYRMVMTKNAMDCTRDGYITSHVFHARNSREAALAPVPYCIGQADNPYRHFIFPGYTSCDMKGWNTYAVFWGPGCFGACTGLENQFHESVQLWEGYNLYRLYMYPGFKEGKNGWMNYGSAAYHCRHFPPTPDEIKVAKPIMVDLKKRAGRITEATGSLITCGQNLIGYFSEDLIDKNTRAGTLLLGENVPNFVNYAREGGYRKWVSTARIDNQGKTSAGDFMNIQLQIDKKTYAHVELAAGYKFGARAIRHALNISLNSGQTVILPKPDSFLRRSVAFITMVMVGVISFLGMIGYSAVLTIDPPGTAFVLNTTSLALS